MPQLRCGFAVRAAARLHCLNLWEQLPGGAAAQWGFDRAVGNEGNEQGDQLRNRSRIRLRSSAGGGVVGATAEDADLSSSPTLPTPPLRAYSS